MVRVLCRSVPTSKRFPGPVEISLGDVQSEGAVAAAAEGASTVFHLAGLLHNPRPGPSDLSLYEAVNVGGARNVARAATRNRAAVILFSTISVYGATRGAVDESAPVNPEGPYATTKWRSEEVLLNAGVDVSILRFAAVYGSQMKGNYARLVDALRRRRFVAVGDGSNRRTLVHEEDAVRAALLAADQVKKMPGVYNVTDGSTHAMNDILKAICMALNRPEPSVRIPAGLARVLSRAVGRAHLVDKYLENVEVLGDRIQARLGFTPRFDLAAGWREALRVQGSD